MRRFMFLMLMANLVVFTGCSTDSRFASPESTLAALVEAANADDVSTFVGGIDLVPMLQQAGLSDTEIESFMEGFAEQIDTPEYSVLLPTAKGFMAVFASANFAVLVEEEVNESTRALLVKVRMKTSGAEQTTRLYFTRRDTGWLLNPELTQAMW